MTMYQSSQCEDSDKKKRFSLQLPQIPSIGAVQIEIKGFQGSASSFE